MIETHWKRISGLHVQEDGTGGAVWIAHDKDADTIHLYDCCMFRREVFSVIAEGLNARGRWIPVSWPKSAKAISKELLDRGCNMQHDPAEDDQAVAEVISRELWERTRTGRFKVDKRLKEWHDEYTKFFKEGAKVPLEKFPLMSATRHALGQIGLARRQAPARPPRALSRKSPSFRKPQ